MAENIANSGKRKADPQSVTGYVVDVSPVKIAKSTGKQYFRMEIQTANKIDSALCFSPSKRQLFNELCEDRKGCTINNVKSGKDVLYVNDYSTIEEKELGFPQSPDVNFMTVAEAINQVSVDSKVNVRGVVILDEVRNIRVRDEDVSIREGYLVDENNCIKLTLWREYCDILENRVTYDLRNLLKIKYSGEIRLQSVHNTSYSQSVEQIDDYQEIPVVQDLVVANVKINSIDSSLPLCPECNKPVKHDEQKAVVKCGNCLKVVLSSSLKRKRNHLISITDGLENRKLSLSCHVMQQCFPDKDISTMDEDQLFLLLLTNTFIIYYKDVSTHVTQLQIV